MAVAIDSSFIAMYPMLMSVLPKRFTKGILKRRLCLQLGKQKVGSISINAISAANGLLIPCTMQRYWSA